MVSRSPPRRPSANRLSLSPQLQIAVGGGALVALAFIVMPTGLLERLVLASGIPAVLAAAEPPLGFTARIALGGVLGGLLAVFLWVGMGLLDEDNGIGQAVLKRLQARDAHPDAPRRAPLSARELGEPTPPPPAERPLPADLDQPLAAYDPGALMAVPLAPSEAVASLTAGSPPSLPLGRPALIDPGDRFETFEMTPVQRPPLAVSEPVERAPSLRVPPTNSLRTLSLREGDTPASLRADPPVAAPQPMVAPATESSVHALLSRLERGLRHAAAPVPAPGPAPAASPPPMPSLRSGGIQDTLGDLRRLATGVR